MNVAAQQLSSPDRHSASYRSTGPSSGCPAKLGISLEQGRWANFVERRVIQHFECHRPKANSSDLERCTRAVVRQLIKRAYLEDPGLPQLMMPTVHAICAKKLKHLKDPLRRSQELVAQMIGSGQLERVRHGRSHYTLQLAQWPSIPLLWHVDIHTPKTSLEAGIWPQTGQNEDAEVQCCVLDSVGEDADDPAHGDSIEVFQAKQARRLRRASEAYNLATREDRACSEAIAQPHASPQRRVSAAWVIGAAPDLVTTAEDLAFWASSKVTRGDVLGVLASVRRQVARKRHRGRPSALLNGAALRHHHAAPVAWRVAL